MVSNDDRLAAARTSYTEYVEKRLEPFLESNKNLTWCLAVKWGLRNDMDFSINAGNIESTEIQEEYVELCIELLEANIANEREDATLMELPSKSDKPPTRRKRGREQNGLQSWVTGPHSRYHADANAQRPCCRDSDRDRGKQSGRGNVRDLCKKYRLSGAKLRLLDSVE